MNRLFVLVILLFCTSSLFAQLDKKLYYSNVSIDSLNQKKLLFELDNISFFKDNEYKASIQKGYSLPGFWLQPKLVYYPLKNLKLEVGAHFLRYWGAFSYPYGAYMGIAEWNKDHYQKGFHALPWLRAQVDFGQWSIVFGNIYGKSNHRLITPLYSNELNLTADPEAGLQILHSSKYIDLDVWIDWKDFIFQQDTHQEVFFVALSSRFKFNEEEKPFHFYAPLQVIAQHRGGEIDTIVTNSVQTLINGAVGVGGVWNVNHRILKRVGVEADFTCSFQQAGHLWPCDSGTGYLINAYSDLRDFRVKAAWWMNRDFISLMGNPFYSALSSNDKSTLFHSPEMCYVGLEYAKTIAKGFSIGADFDFFLHLPFDHIQPNGERKHESLTNSFSAGAYLRVNPSILIKNFQKK